MKRYKIRFLDETIEVEGTLFFITNDSNGPAPRGEDNYIFINASDVVYIQEIKK